MDVHNDVDVYELRRVKVTRPLIDILVDQVVECRLWPETGEYDLYVDDDGILCRAATVNLNPTAAKLFERDRRAFWEHHGDIVNDSLLCWLNIVEGDT